MDLFLLRCINQSKDNLTKIATILLVTHVYSLSGSPSHICCNGFKKKEKIVDNIMSHLNFDQICYERVAFLWVVLLQACVIVLHYITESVTNTAVKVDGKGPLTTTLGHYTSSACYYTVAHKV